MSNLYQSISLLGLTSIVCYAARSVGNTRLGRSTAEINSVSRMKRPCVVHPKANDFNAQNFLLPRDFKGDNAKRRLYR
jgi:hypothetical protein